MDITEFAEWLRQLRTEDNTPMLANVYTTGPFPDEAYSRLVTQSNTPCAFVWKRNDYPDSVFEMDCFVKHGEETDTYLQTLDEKLKELLQMRYRVYRGVSYQGQGYMQFSLKDAILKHSEAWIRDLMQCIVLDNREWQDCPASQIIQDILSDFGSKIGMRVQLEGVWQDRSIQSFRTHWNTAYQSLDILVSGSPESIMKCSMLGGDTISVFFNRAEAGSSDRRR